MLYDTMPHPPRHRSVLESVFFLVYRERKITDLLATKAMITGLALASQRDKLDPVFDEFERYANEMLPFLTDDLPEKDDAKEALHHFVQYKAEIDLRPVYRAQVQGALSKMSANRNRVRIISGKSQNLADALKGS